jgi:pimeloyl-ACP methyl ester carboxylesterase
MYVKIGGIDQWIQIRGQDRDNPVLLCLHGGPGATWLPLTAVFAPWEKDFTVVQWDQRGAGKSLEASGPSIASTMSIQRMADDGIELAELLRAHLKKEKILLLGHSWGSILGVHMVLQRPDLFYAYVGTGQVAQMTRSRHIAISQVIPTVVNLKCQNGVLQLSLAKSGKCSLHTILLRMNVLLCDRNATEPRDSGQREHITP